MKTQTAVLAIILSCAFGFVAGAKVERIHHDSPRIQEVVKHDARWDKDGIFHRQFDVRPQVQQRSRPVSRSRLEKRRHAVDTKRAAHSQERLHRSVVFKRRAPGSAHTAAPKRTTGIRVHRHKGLTWARTHIIRHIRGGSRMPAVNMVHMKAKAKRSKHYLHIQSRGKSGYAGRTHQSKSKSGAKNTSSFFSTLAGAIRYGGAHSRLHSLHKWPVYRDRNQSAGQAPHAPATHADRTD